MSKRRKDGYLRSSFTFEDKRYYIYGKTKQELIDKETQKRKELEQGAEKKSDPLLKDYFERWYEFHKQSVAPNTTRTIEIRKNILCNVFIPSANKCLGEIKLKKITTDILKELQAQFSINRKSNTVNNYMAMLKQVITNAVKERIIEYNPFDLLKSLKVIEDSARDTYHRALTIEEQSKFFEAECVKNSLFYNVYRMAILSGMRVGEIGALKFKDIKEDYFIVERTITRLHGDVWGIGSDTKTSSGRRIIPITEQIKEIIEEQKRKSYLFYYGDKETEESEYLLFTSQLGKILRHTKINGELKQLCKEVGIEPITMHSFRDTFATRAIESGMTPKTLQEIMGHKNYNITMNIYTHVMKETKIKEMRNLHITI